MAKQLQLRRGTTAANDLFTGADGEVTVDTTNHSLRVHNGSTQGGYLVDTVIAFQRPSIDNNYTWYRKYASGWVEMGGEFTQTANSAIEPTITFPVELADTHYMIVWSAGAAGTTAGTYFAHQVVESSKATTGCQVKTGNNNTTFTVLNWQVSYMAA